VRTRKPDVFLGRQPILDSTRTVVAYELLFRSDDGRAHARVCDDALATARVVSHALRKFGIQTVVGTCRAFINVDAESLLSRMIETLPPANVVLEILETVDIDERVLRRCHQLRARGYHLALDDVCGYREAYDQLLDLIDIVKIDLALLDPHSLATLVRRLRLHPVRLLAEKVDTLERVRLSLELGFDYMQGFFLGRPVLLTG
jgi:EAL and modified HD-GYP domain-containing signal transduction protein